MKSPIYSFSLFFLAGQFFPPLFAFISSSMFWQNTLLIPKEVYHEKEKNSNSIHRNQRVGQPGYSSKKAPGNPVPGEDSTYY